MKTRKLTKNELLKLIRESKHERFEIVEPVTPETVGKILPMVKKEAGQSAYLTVIVIQHG